MEDLSGIVYSISHKEFCYVGSTSKSAGMRWSDHLSDYKTRKGRISSSIVFEKAEIDGVLPTYIILEKYSEINDEDLRRREQSYLDEFVCVNKVRAYQTEEQLKEQRNKQARKCRDKNREKINERKRKHRDENREEINEQRRKWRQDNLDKARENGRKWRKDNLDKQRELERKYHEDNKEKRNEQQRKRRAEKKINANTIDAQAT